MISWFLQPCLLNECIKINLNPTRHRGGFPVWEQVTIYIWTMLEAYLKALLHDVSVVYDSSESRHVQVWASCCIRLVDAISTGMASMKLWDVAASNEGSVVGVKGWRSVNSLHWGTVTGERR